MFFLKKPSTFYSFFLSFLIVLMIPLITSGILYSKIHLIVESVEKESNLALLEKSKDSLDIGLKEIERMVISMGNDPYVRKFATQNNPLDGASRYYLYELVRHLESYNARNQFAHSFYIYFRNSGKVIIPKTTYEISDFYMNYLKYNNMTYNEWQDLFLKYSHEKSILSTSSVNIDPLDFNMLTYIQSFPKVYSKDPTIVIWVFIDEEPIKKLLSNINTNGCVYIFNENGNVMLSLLNYDEILKVDISQLSENRGFFDQSIEDERMIISYTTSSYNGWKYVSIVPYEIVMIKTRFIKFLITGIGIVILILGLITTYLLTLRSTKPLREVVKFVKKRSPLNNFSDKNEYDFIKNNVRKIFEINETFEREMQKQLPILRASFFECLLKGEYSKEDEVQLVLSHLGIDIKGSFFSAIIIHIDVYDNSIYDNSITNRELNSLFKAKAIIKNIIGKKYNSRIKYHDTIEDEIVLIMCFIESEYDDYRIIGKRTIHEIFNILNHYCPVV